MKPRDLADLLLLAALWGASFLFIRIAAPDFGPVPLAALRVGIGGLVLLPLLILREGLPRLRAAMLPIFVVGVINSALPFTLLAFAALSLTAGLVSILNASSPLFGAVIAYLWLKDRLSPLRVAGLFVGFIGVLVLVWGKASFKPGGSGIAIMAALLAALFYGVAANYTKKRLTGVNSLAVAAGSQLGGAAAMFPLAVWYWPAVMPGLKMWLIAVVLGVGCTGIAYMLYFRLIANVGAARAITVTFLIPVFGVMLGALFLGEIPTLNMLAGCAVILLGTALATGLLKRRGRQTRDSRLETR